MARLVIRTQSGSTLEAPFEAWVVAVINSLPRDVQQAVFKRVATMEGATLIPDKFQFISDELGTATFVEKPVLDLGGRLT